MYIITFSAMTIQGKSILFDIMQESLPSSVCDMGTLKTTLKNLCMKAQKIIITDVVIVNITDLSRLTLLDKEYSFYHVAYMLNSSKGTIFKDTTISHPPSNVQEVNFLKNSLIKNYQGMTPGVDVMDIVLISITKIQENLVNIQ